MISVQDNTNCLIVQKLKLGNELMFLLSLSNYSMASNLFFGPTESILSIMSVSDSLFSFAATSHTFPSNLDILPLS